MSLTRVVIDTNVIIAAVRSQRGASSLLVSKLGSGLFSAHLSVPLALEYEEVLLRQKRALGMTEDDVGRYVDALCAVSEKHEIYFLWRPTLRDIDDDAILELAVSARCDYILTYNQRDFIGAEKFGVDIQTPKEFLEIIGELP